jgi:hypothetical protein
MLLLMMMDSGFSHTVPHTTQHMNQRIVTESHFQNTLLHILMILPPSQPNLLMFLGATTFFGDA